MEFFKNFRLMLPVLGLGMLVPVQASASTPVPVPEPLSLALIATGVAGLGAVEILRRRRGK